MSASENFKKVFLIGPIFAIQSSLCQAASARFNYQILIKAI